MSCGVSLKIEEHGIKALRTARTWHRTVRECFRKSLSGSALLYGSFQKVAEWMPMFAQGEP